MEQQFITHKNIKYFSVINNGGISCQGCEIGIINCYGINCKGSSIIFKKISTIRKEKIKEIIKNEEKI